MKFARINDYIFKSELALALCMSTLFLSAPLGAVENISIAPLELKTALYCPCTITLSSNALIDENNISIAINGTTTVAKEDIRIDKDKDGHRLAATFFCDFKSLKFYFPKSGPYILNISAAGNRKSISIECFGKDIPELGNQKEKALFDLDVPKSIMIRVGDTSNKDRLIKLLQGSDLAAILDASISITEIGSINSKQIKSKQDYLDKCAAITMKSEIFQAASKKEGTGIYRYESMYYHALCLANGKSESVNKALVVSKQLSEMGIPNWSEKAKLLSLELAKNINSPEIQSRTR